jgi:alpha-mannosidase
MSDVFSDSSVLLKRAERVINEIIRPAVRTDDFPLEVAVYQCAEPIKYEVAIKQSFTPVRIGFEWGPVWSTAWFRLRGKVPASWAGKDWRVIFDTDTEALLWYDGGPYQGVEFHRQDVKLPATVTAGSDVELYIEAACNHMAGLDLRAGLKHAGTFNSRMAGKLKQAHLAIHHPDRAAALLDMELLLDLATKLPTGTPRSRQIRDALRHAVNAVDATDPDRTASAVRLIAQKVLTMPTQGGSNTAHCVGHAHIDLAYLWPIRETKRKCSRTFSTVLRNMERHPGYRFIQSQAQAYEWVRQDYPKLFEGIKKAVARGQWEPGGAMWVEADCNLSSGESLIRQIVHGTRFWAEHFNVSQRYLWLPDVFGYSAALPQILKLAGLDAFFTQKISWSEFNKFPYHTFHWQGIDGTEILSHFLPTDNYNAENAIGEFVRAESQFNQSARSPHWLQAYGYGDGGGGPSEPMIERIDRLANCAGLPNVKHSRVDEFVDVLLENQDDLPKWVGELYLELHRGTYTTQARNKRFNRMGERLLQDVETALALGTAPAGAEQTRELDRLWKLLLLNQFHDIIPGSSITWVYEDSLRDYADIDASGNKLLRDAVGRVETSTKSHRGWAILSTTSHRRRALIECPATFDLTTSGLSTQSTVDLLNEPMTLALTSELPGPGLFSVTAGPVVAPVKVGALTLENELLRAELDHAGRVISLFDKRHRREAIDATSPANALMLYEDRPKNYEAWDVDISYLETGTAIDAPAEHRVIETGPIRGAIEFVRKIGEHSTLTQRVQLVAGEAMLRFETLVDWQESRKFLRVLHPVEIHNDQATYEIQFGHVRRPTHFNTSWDYARFEVCAQRWMDLSESGFGVAMLNDSKYGHSCHGNVMGLSLLRSAKYPDATADMAAHRFTYALMPHGSFDAAEIVTAAEQLNNPARLFAGAAATGALLTIEGDARDSVVVETIKPADDGDGLIVRMWECRGGRADVSVVFSARLLRAVETDLLERCTRSLDFAGSTIELEFKPFQIRTLHVSLSAERA